MNAESELAVCSGSQRGQLSPGEHQAQQCQQAREGAVLICTAAGSPPALGAALGATM